MDTENSLLFTSFFDNHFHIWICYYVYVCSFLCQAKQSGFLQALLLDYAFHTLILLISFLNSFQLVRMSLEAWCLKLDTDPYSRSLAVLMKEDYFPCLHTGLLFLHRDTIPHAAFAPAWHWFVPSLWIAIPPKSFFRELMGMRNRRMLPQKFRLALAKALSVAHWWWDGLSLWLVL